MEKEVTIDYTNWRGERRKRVVRPIGVHFGHNKWHQKPQWLLQAMDVEDRIVKTFAMNDIHQWGCPKEEVK